MANTDSFIDEVNEELRRDRLYRLFRKWGWLPVLVILLIVGAAAWREYSIAQDRAEAEAFGDALIGALESEGSEDRVAALQSLNPDEAEAAMLVDLLIASEQAQSDDPAVVAEAAATLRDIAARDGVSPRYGDLAALQAHMLDPLDLDAAMAELNEIARPGRPYRVLAMEQQALLHAANGDVEAAVGLLRLLEEDSEATTGLQQRAAQLIVALESGATLAEPAPEETAAPEDDGAVPAETPVTEDEDSPAGDGTDSQ